MKWNDIYNFYKSKYTDYLIFYKIGNFYNVIGNDIYIMRYVFDYKIVTNNGIDKVGFPIANINKVMDKLNELKINYLTIEKCEGIVKINYKKRFKINNYYNYSSNSNNYCEKKDRINNIISILNKKLDDINFDIIIGKVEKILNEG